MDNGVRKIAIFRLAKVMVIQDKPNRCPDESINYEDAVEGFGCEFDNKDKYPYLEKCTECWINYLETLEDEVLSKLYDESKNNMTADYFLRIQSEESEYRKKLSKDT